MNLMKYRLCHYEVCVYVKDGIFLTAGFFGVYIRVYSVCFRDRTKIEIEMSIDECWSAAGPSVSMYVRRRYTFTFFYP
jgi:hypothetical protein